jgi:hypothetical protein
MKILNHLGEVETIILKRIFGKKKSVDSFSAG